MNKNVDINWSKTNFTDEDNLKVEAFEGCILIYPERLTLEEGPYVCPGIAD